MQSTFLTPFLGKTATPVLTPEQASPVVTPSPFAVAILGGLQGRHIYAGTVPAKVIARRRAANKAARAARRAHR